jgi:ZIP family zinc transporter
MQDWFPGLHPIQQALAGTLFTWFVTALDAATVFFPRSIDKRILDSMLGFAVMMLLDVALG